MSCLEPDARLFLDPDEKGELGYADPETRRVFAFPMRNSWVTLYQIKLSIGTKAPDDVSAARQAQVKINDARYSAQQQDATILEHQYQGLLSIQFGPLHDEFLGARFEPRPLFNLCIRCRSYGKATTTRWSTGWYPSATLPRNSAQSTMVSKIHKII
jgi:hypothetical protein